MAKFEHFINQSIRALASPRAGFVLAIFGVIAQTYHTYNVTVDISLIPGLNKIIQAVVMSVFLSGGLLFYTIRASNAINWDEEVKYGNIATGFAVFESFVNLYYWLSKIIFIPAFQTSTPDWSTPQWYKLIIAIPFALAIPIILKQYAGEIKLEKIETETPPTQVAPVVDDILQKEVSNLKAQMENLHDLLGGNLSMEMTNMTPNAQGLYTIKLSKAEHHIPEVITNN